MVILNGKWVWRMAGIGGMLIGAGADYLMDHSWPYLGGLVLLIWGISTLSLRAISARLHARPKHFMAAMVISMGIKIAVAASGVLLVVKAYHVSPLVAVPALLIAYFAYTALEIHHLLSLLKNHNPIG